MTQEKEKGADKTAEILSKISLAQKKKSKGDEIDYLGYFLLLVLIFITVFTRPDWSEKVSVHHVWYYGWITAISTGLGAIPFYFFPEPDKFWMGVSNGRRTILAYIVGEYSFLSATVTLK